jgi:heavy metal sensor kinase
MSLRLRLTLLYTSLLGAVLILVGAVVFGLVSFVLLNQIDARLQQSADQLVGRLRINLSGQFDPRSVASFQPTENLLFQVWDIDGNLQLSRPVGYQMALSDDGWGVGRPFFTTEPVTSGRLRVLTVPLRTAREPVGYLQVGLSLSLVDVSLQTLAGALAAILLVAMGITGLLAWLVAGRGLSPLATMTEVATQITQADDLSRRIPLSGSPGSEVGRLIRAFNDTMERLEGLFESQRRFVADVSHELRTPLTVIKGEVGLMRRMGQGDEESLSSIENEVDRLTRMVGDLLMLAQAEAGRLPLDLQPVELDTVLLEVFQQVRTLASDRVEVHLEEIDQVVVIGDRDRLKQVVLNLAANAVQYTPKGGRVTLSISKSGEEAFLQVRDTGPGIAAEDLPHIFERFYRAERSRSRQKGGGFGLGLSIAYWIVKAHGGELGVESQMGQGSVFHVRLPLLGPEENESPELVEEAPGWEDR